MQRLTMRRLNVLILLVLLVVSVNVLFARVDVNLNKGIAYLLIGDNGLAEKHLNLYFQKGINPSVKNGFKLLMKGENEDAARHFKSFLDLDHRSSVALVGIALSTAHLSISNTDELLKRAARLDPSYSPAFLCLGAEYLKKKNYPMAEANFKRARRYGNIPEFNILLGRSYLDNGNPVAALALLKKEADRAPDNFYFNFLTAKAYLLLNRLDELGPYIQAALDVKPGNKEARLLTAKYHLNQNNAQKARVILKGIKLDNYDEDYMKTYADVLVNLKDKKARNYLYEVFSRNPWDRDINRLLGLFHLWMVKGGNVQNWIDRAAMSGTDVKRLKELFPDKYNFPEYKSLPFFELMKIEWIGDEKLLVAAKQRSGDRERIFVIDLKRMRVVQTMAFNGTLQEFFLSKDRKHLVFSSTAREGESIYLYYINLTGRTLRLQALSGKPLVFPSAAVGFNSAGTIIYITDSSINKLAFESPFSQESQYGKKTPVYPNYPFHVYKYYLKTRRLQRMKNALQSEVVPPIDVLEKYSLVANAYHDNSRVQGLIEKGQQLDLTSSESVRIYFSKDLDSFIIYLADLKNAFKGVLWDNRNRNARDIDETMFLGKGNYAELNIVDFDPGKKQILVLSKNKKDLILYNYHTHLHITLATEALKAYNCREYNMVYALKARSGNVYFGGAGLQVISLNPYLNKVVGTRMGLTGILGADGESEVNFSTYNGEIVKMDGEFKFTYVKPSLEGSRHAVSPEGNRAAAFINRRLVLIE